MAMAGARAAVAQGRLAGHHHHHHHLLEEEKLVAGADVVDGVDGVAEMVGVDPLEAEVVDGVAGSEQRLLDWLPGVSPPGLEVAEMVGDDCAGESWPP